MASRLQPYGRVALVCPRCAGGLQETQDAITCARCSANYPVSDGIAVLSAIDDGAGAGADHKARQIEFFDGEAAEFEISRPHGQPRLYRWLMGEKFRRSISGLEEFLPGATVLTVCGGSGMDGEFLARRGAAVIASDISVGAAIRTQQRAARFGVPIVALVADAERLPFAARSVDVVYVHDGLHHLSDPLVGLAEMCRVARRCVMVTEPARAAVTAVAIRLGLALETEEAGNRVERVTARQVCDVLVAHGFGSVAANRYAMYYRHRPGRAVRLLSRPRIFGAARWAFRAANVVLGPVGNKLAVRAVREGASS